MRLNSIGVAEGLSCNACDRIVTGSSLKRDLSQLLEHSSRPWIAWQGMALSSLNVMHCHSIQGLLQYSTN